MNSIEFEIKLTLTANLTNQRIKLFFQNKNLLLEKNNTKEIILFVSYNEDVNRIKLIDFSQFLPESDPYIKIQKMSINDYDVKDFYNLLSFNMKDNLYVENKKINYPKMVNFNGTLYLEVDKNKDRFTWFPLTFSKSKNQIVFKNDFLNCSNEVGCWSGCTVEHNPAWQKFNFNEYVEQIHYDYIALGCSVTAGTAILKKDAWPNLLKQEGWNVLNFGVSGSGNDQIFLNVKELLRKKVKFSKMIILLPGVGRQLLRISKHGYFFNCFISASGKVEKNHFNIYFKKDELESIYKKAQRKLVMSDYYKRDILIIKKLLSLLHTNSIDFYISSNDDNIYDLLESCVGKKNLLPKFNKDKDNSVGVDGKHPSGDIHKKWVEDIKNQISH